MPSPHLQTAATVTWDGSRLSLSSRPQLRFRLTIDGSPFSTLETDDQGRATLAFAFSPSGNDRLGLRLQADEAIAPCAAIECDIEWGTPGLLPVRGEPRALRPLVDADMLVALDAQPLQREVAVVVPVYNAADAVRRCLDSVLAHTQGTWRLIVIDDASSEAAIVPLLDRYRGFDGVEILGNPHNLGFTATVNRGIRLAGRADVVLLNADTEVAANWLDGLRLAAASAVDVGTATAVSDNAGAFSVPELERENPLPTHWSFAQAARALWQDAGHAYPQLPTGNGFCMYIKREVFDAIGEFDVAAFPQGYGEENDFCQRACARGYRHLIAGNVFVAHARSSSFGVERREALGRAGMQVLRERWPGYEAEVGATLFSFERRVLDWRVRRIYSMASRHTPQPRVLRIDGIPPGSPPTGDRETFELACVADACILHGATGAALESVPAAHLDGSVAAVWLQRHAIERIEIGAAADRAIAEPFIAQARRLGIALGDDASTNRTPASIANAALARPAGVSG